MDMLVNTTFVAAGAAAPAARALAARAFLAAVFG